MELTTREKIDNIKDNFLTAFALIKEAEKLFQDNAPEILKLYCEYLFENIPELESIEIKLYKNTTYLIKLNTQLSVEDLAYHYYDFIDDIESKLNNNIGCRNLEFDIRYGKVDSRIWGDDCEHIITLKKEDFNETK